MGRKLAWSRQCFYFYVTGLVVFIFVGCATLESIKNRHIANRYLVRSQMLLAAGEYEEAIEENERILTTVKSGYPRDEALFNIALIYAHHDNPQKDVSKSFKYFKRVIEDYPKSQLREQAKIWLGILMDIEKSEMELSEKNERLTSNVRLLRSQKLISDDDFKGAINENEKIIKMSDTGNFKDYALFNMGLIYAHHDNPDKDYNQSIKYFERLIKEYPESPLADQAKIWQGILNIIEKAKQVDIEIEKKQKELSR